MNNFSILVNTSDKYEDCWHPFFQLMSKYWKGYKCKIYLNTETKDFFFDNLNIFSIKACNYIKKKNITWSECVLSALDLIGEKIVLQMFEDTFLVDNVNYIEIQKISELMIAENIAFIGLGESIRPFHKSKFENLVEVDQYADYRINTQPALWNISLMKKYLRAHEDPWEFEIYGTKRSHIIRDKIYNINTSYYITSLFPYVEGIRRGKWEKHIIKVFDKNNINVDYDKRGFFDYSVKRSLASKIISRFNFKRNINRLHSEFDILRLRKTYFKNS